MAHFLRSWRLNNEEEVETLAKEFFASQGKKWNQRTGKKAASPCVKVGLWSRGSHVSIQGPFAALAILQQLREGESFSERIFRLKGQELL